MVLSCFFYIVTRLKQELNGSSQTQDQALLCASLHDKITRRKPGSGTDLRRTRRGSGVHLIVLIELSYLGLPAQAYIPF